MAVSLLERSQSTASDNVVEEACDIFTDTPAGIQVTVIERASGWRFVNWRELYAYRDLLWFLTWRNIKVLYAQSAIGIGWAVLQPLCSTLIFTVVFGRFVRVESDGVPYLLFSFAALVPWTYFSNALLEASNSLVSQAHIINKIYFPRIILPWSGIFAKLLDFGIAMMLLLGLAAWHGYFPTRNTVFLPLLVVIMLICVAGLGMWLTAMAIQYRDVKHALNFAVQLLMYAAPVVYPTTLVPIKWRTFYAINPMVGVIEGFRSALLGTRPMPWDWIGIGGLTAVILLVTGMMYFRHQERLFADVA